MYTRVESLCDIVRVLLKNSVMASAARLAALLGAHLCAAAATTPTQMECLLLVFANDFL